MSQHSGHQQIISLLSNLNLVNRKHQNTNTNDQTHTNYQGKTFIKNKNSNHSLTQIQHSKHVNTSLLTQKANSKQSWKCNGRRQLQQQFQRLNHKHELDTWQISRMQLSDRSYLYPKEYKGIKIPEKGKQFSAYSSRDKQGHLPYLYQNDTKKYESLKQKLTIVPFKVTNSVQKQYFGFGKRMSSGKRIDSHKKHLKINSQIFSNKKHNI